MKRIFLTLVLLPFMAVSANAQSLIVGDANGDGSLDISDVVTIVNRILDGNPVSYHTCPNNNHPHLIDLGLPSGTLWSCCNVDASKPQDNGGYYSWGETQTKSQYDISTYSHFDTTNRYHHLGYDISGTKYDVAHVKWKGYWKMPNSDQFNEILAYCNYEFTTVGGVQGIKFTGTNGGSVFFPNSGAFVGTTLSDDDTFGQIWSSTFPRNFSLNYGPADVFSYQQGDGGSGDLRVLTVNRFHGFTVRPIRNESSCDANGDGSIDISDVVFVVNRILDGKIAYRACPDNNHPHKIDLGLPSGTLWSCCNVGALSPSSPGNYYAWGETAPKYYYSASTYIHCDDQDMSKCHNIGSSIIGTEYDAASEWGDSWQMPSLTQVNELLAKCSREWTKQGSLNGIIFTGPNGSSIFLPAAGFALDETTDYNQSGYYWMGEQNSSKLSFAYMLCIDENECLRYNLSREYGLSVRPVAK